MLKSCKHGHDETSEISIIISTVILTLLAILGIFGNILVLLVYCLKRSTIPLKNRPQSILSHVTGLEKEVKKRKNSAQSTQRHLILALATVDLVTCIAILPMDIFRSLLKYIKANDVKFMMKLHLFDDLLDSLRNIAFAFEGCILSAIALDRFLTLTYNSVVKDSGRITQRRSLCEKLRSKITREKDNNKPATPKQHDKQSYTGSSSDTPSIDKIGRSISETPSISEQTNGNNNKRQKCFCVFCYCQCYNKIELDHQGYGKVELVENYSQDCLFCGFRLMNKKLKISPILKKPMHLFTSKLVKANTRLKLVWLLIMLLNLMVISIEISVLTVHYFELYKWEDCSFTKSMRLQVNRIYLLATSLSIVIIAYLYVRVFIAIHRQDVKNRRIYCSQKTLDGGGEANNQGYQSASATAAVETITQTSNIFLENNRTNDMFKRKSFVAKFGDQWRVISRNQRIRARRTGLMLFISTVVFYATLFPLMWVHFSWWSDADQNATSFQMHHEFYYINNAINVLIYSFLNPNFRTKLSELKNTLMKTS